MMTVELQPDEFARVLPLYREAGVCFPLISAVIQGGQRGQVFADRRELPSSALVVTDFGFMFLAGAEQNAPFDASLSRLFANGDALKPSYLMWYSPPAGWQRRLDEFGSEVVRRRERVRFEFREERAGWLAEPVECPDGFELKHASAELLPEAEKLGLKLDSRFWASAAEFVEHGLGVFLMRGDEVVSLCYAAAVADGLAEVDVATAPEFRERGLAGVVAKQFAKECLRRGVTPTWDCFEYNAGSMKLAEKLGFVETRRYPFYNFNVPLRAKGGTAEAITQS